MNPQEQKFVGCILRYPKEKNPPYGSTIFLPFSYKISKYKYLQKKFYDEKPKQQILTRLSDFSFIPAAIIALVVSVIYMSVCFLLGKSAEAKQHVDFWLCKLQVFTDRDYIVDFPLSFAHVNKSGYNVVMYYSKNKFERQSKRKKEKTLALLNKMKDDLYFADYFFASKHQDVIEYARGEKINLRKFYCVNGKEFELATGYDCPRGISYSFIS